jgi:hypothetical protein
MAGEVISSSHLKVENFEGARVAQTKLNVEILQDKLSKDLQGTFRLRLQP